MVRREKISAVDTAWLRMDRPGNLMMICAVLSFGEPIGVDALKSVVAERFVRFRRFLQRPVDAPTGAFWETTRDFDLDHHVVHVALPGAAGKRELQALVSRLAATPLNPAWPLWQFHVVENYGAGSAVIIRIHHCYADGIALVQVLLSMTDVARGGPPALAPPSAKSKHEGAADNPLGELVQPLADALILARKLGASLLDNGSELLQNPQKAIALAEQVGALTGELTKLALMGQDSPTRFKGVPGVAKRVAWAERLPLDEVKTVGRALGASVNDILLSCVAGALREYLAGKGDPTDGVMMRALVPVNLRAPAKAYKLGNQFGLVFLELPIGIENPVERLYAVRANMRALKGSYQPVLALGLLAAMGAGPKILQEQLLLALARNASAVMTNVPGPQQPLYFAGAKIAQFMFWVPQSGNIGMGVSILSYDGAVQFGLIADRGLVPDPEHVIANFGPEFEEACADHADESLAAGGRARSRVAARRAVSRGPRRKAPRGREQLRVVA
jgi:WS/DGAT/MGAT family acyltransferase